MKLLFVISHKLLILFAYFSIFSVYSPAVVAAPSPANQTACTSEVLRHFWPEYSPLASSGLALPPASVNFALPGEDFTVKANGSLDRRFRVESQSWTMPVARNRGSAGSTAMQRS